MTPGTSSVKELAGMFLFAFELDCGGDHAGVARVCGGICPVVRGGGPQPGDVVLAGAGDDESDWGAGDLREDPYFFELEWPCRVVDGDKSDPGAVEHLAAQLFEHDRDAWWAEQNARQRANSSPRSKPIDLASSVYGDSNAESSGCISASNGRCGERYSSYTLRLARMPMNASEDVAIMHCEPR